MKKLNKMQIDSEKLMKNEELISLRGGYYTYECWLNGVCSGLLKGTESLSSLNE